MKNYLIERFSYDLEMKTREQNRNNKLTEIERFNWFIERIQTLVAFGWLRERSEEKNFMPENFLEINRHFALTSYCNTIGQSKFFGGKTQSACFDLFIHWLIKQITNTFSYENHSDTLKILAFEAPSTQIRKFFKPRVFFNPGNYVPVF